MRTAALTRGRAWSWVPVALVLAFLLPACGGGSTATSSTSTREDAGDVAGDPGGTADEFCADLEEWLTTTYEGVFDAEQVATVESLTTAAPDQLVAPLETIGAEMARIAELNTTDPDAAIDAFGSIGPESEYMAAVGEVWAFAGSRSCHPG